MLGMVWVIRLTGYWFGFRVIWLGVYNKNLILFGSNTTKVLLIWEPLKLADSFYPDPLKDTRNVRVILGVGVASIA